MRRRGVQPPLAPRRRALLGAGELPPLVIPRPQSPAPCTPLPPNPPPKAAWGAVRAYLQLHDAKGAPSGGEGDEDAALAGLSAEERKKEKQRRKKEEKRLAKEAADRAAAEEARRAAEREAAAGGKDKGGKKKAARCARGAGPRAPLARGFARRGMGPEPSRAPPAPAIC
jgi:hypothetical protein